MADRLKIKHGAVFKKPPGAATPADVLPVMTATETDTADPIQTRGTAAVQTIRNPTRTLEEIADVCGDIEQYHLTEFSGERPPRPGHPAVDRR